jgi:hypothetical protein
MDAAELLMQIRDSFPVNPLPDMTLHQGQLADQSLAREIPEAEWNAEGEKDRTTPWPAFEAQDLVNCEAALSHLDENAFVYYLPAFLTFAVHNLNSESFPHGRAVNSTVCAVTQRSNYNLARLKRLSDAQIDAVISFLRFVRDNDKGHTYGDLAGKALKRYWETPDARRRTLIQAP